MPEISFEKRRGGSVEVNPTLKHKAAERIPTGELDHRFQHHLGLRMLDEEFRKDFLVRQSRVVSGTLAQLNKSHFGRIVGCAWRIFVFRNFQHLAVYQIEKCQTQQVR